MSNNLNYNNAYEQSGINYSNRGSCPNYCNKRSERGTMRTQFDNEFWNINHITHSRTARSNIWEIVVGCSAYSCMQRRSSSSSSNSRLLFNHTLTKRHLERLWKNNFMQSSCRSAWRPRQNVKVTDAETVKMSIIYVNCV